MFSQSHPVGSLLRAGADLVVPTTCGGCARRGVAWCERCRIRLCDAPRPVQPHTASGIPTWAMGPYRGPYRSAVIAVKEHGRRDLAAPLGVAMAAAIATLARWGEIPDAPTLHLIPAPTRALAARRRGGDPVTRIAREAAKVLGPRVHVDPLLVTDRRARDSAGLDAAARAANLRGNIRLSQPRPVSGPSLLLDDVLTTGTTSAESVRVLTRAGIGVAAVLVIAAA